MKALLVLGIGLALVSSGCFAKIYQLPSNTTNKPVFPSLQDPETPVGLAISGGGSRAATFAAGALEALAGLRIRDGGRENSVLEKVNYISSVSGGSLAAAYYAIKKPPKTEPMLDEKGMSPTYQNFFAVYKADMRRNFQRRAAIRQVLFFRAFNPTKLAYSFSEVWDSAFFDEITFSGLYDRERRGDSPRLILNGTLYNDGRRFVLTTLPATDFSYDFVKLLKNTLATPERKSRVPPTELPIIETSLERARRQFLPVTFEEIRGNHRDLRVSLAVATSASFPPVVGPVTYQVKDDKTIKQAPYNHVGDGGLFDNLGTESLTEVFLQKIPQNSPRKGLIIIIDASFPFDVHDVELDTDQKGFEVFVEDPSRIVGIMEERANAYQTILWQVLRSEQVLLPDFDHLRIVLLKHTDAAWTGYGDLPPECAETLPTGTAGTDDKRLAEANHQPDSNIVHHQERVSRSPPDQSGSEGRRAEPRPHRQFLSGATVTRSCAMQCGQLPDVRQTRARKEE